MSETQSVGTKKRASANRLKRRLDKDTSLEDLLDGWTQCCYLVPRKLKLCNVARTDGSIYCGNHQPSESAIVQATGDDAGSSTKHSKSQERIPCPIDSTHSIFKHNLRYHISVCTKAKQNNAMSELPYYRLNCNSYDPSANVLCGPCDNGSSEVANIDPQSLAVKVNSVYNDIMAQYFSSGAVNTIQEGGELIIPTNTSTVRAADGASTAGTTTAGTETATTSTSTIKIVDLALADKITSKLGQELKSQRKLRHVDQDILIVQQMIDNGLIQHSGTSGMSSRAVYAELGAGRGLLSYAVSCADPSATVVLVERSGSRRKVDKALKDDFALLRSQFSPADVLQTTTNDAVTEPGAQETQAIASTGAIIRARMDIRHCLLPNLPGVNPPLAPLPSSAAAAEGAEKAGDLAPKQPVVVIAKHLCGVATDLAIHSVRSFPHIPVTHTESTAAGVAGHQVGLAIATCCHHACQFADYAGKEWFLAQGFTAAEFEVLKKWSGWANSVNLNITASLQQQTSAGKNDIKGVDDREDLSTQETNQQVDNQDDNLDEEQAEVSAHQAPLCPQVMRPANITPPEMQLLGWQVKRIFDHGRVEYINRYYNMSARQIRYCDRILSPECVMLLAREW